MNVSQNSVKKFLNNKLNTINDTPEGIKGVADILVNSKHLKYYQDIEQAIKEAYGDRFNSKGIVQEWEEYAYTTYTRMQIPTNKDYVSTSILNATIFIYNFIEKFMI